MFSKELNLRIIHKIKELKAIHNEIEELIALNKTCELSIKLRNWKQFTTKTCYVLNYTNLRIIHKIKELKAIHNVQISYNIKPKPANYP